MTMPQPRGQFVVDPSVTRQVLKALLFHLQHTNDFLNALELTDEQRQALEMVRTGAEILNETLGAVLDQPAADAGSTVKPETI